jgi:hypothetical protein
MPRAHLECRAEIGIHHRTAGAHLFRHAQESNGDQVSRVAALAMKRGKSVTSPDIGSGTIPTDRLGELVKTSQSRFESSFTPLPVRPPQFAASYVSGGGMTDGGASSSRRQGGRHSERSRVLLLKPAAPAVSAAADKQHNDNYDDEKRGGYPYPCPTPPGGAVRCFGAHSPLQPTPFDRSTFP